MRTTEFLNLNGKLYVYTYSTGGTAETKKTLDEISNGLNSNDEAVVEETIKKLNEMAITDIEGKGLFKGKIAISDNPEYIDNVISTLISFRKQSNKIKIKNNDLSFIFSDNQAIIKDYKELSKMNPRVGFLCRLFEDKKKYKLQKKIIAGALAAIVFSGGSTAVVASEEIDAGAIEPTTKVEVTTDAVDKDENLTTEVVVTTTEPTTSAPTTTEKVTEKPTTEPTTKKQTYSTFEEEMIKRYNVGSEIDCKKYKHVVENYGDIIGKYCDMYGLNKDLMIAIATQERGYHSSEIDSNGMIGLMQIHYNVHVGSTIKVYNVQENKWESIKITDEMVRSLDGNIKAALAIYSRQKYIHDNNELAALGGFGYGEGTYGEFLEEYCYRTGMTEEEALDTNLYMIDLNYYSEVLRYYDGDIAELSVENTK